jgi:hypothetical protein
MTTCLPSAWSRRAPRRLFPTLPEPTTRATVPPDHADSDSDVPIHAVPTPSRRADRPRTSGRPDRQISGQTTSIMRCDEYQDVAGGEIDGKIRHERRKRLRVGSLTVGSRRTRTDTKERQLEFRRASGEPPGH